MSASVATIPAIALATKPAKLLLSASTGNFVRVWCTDAPRDSKLKNALLESGAAKVAVVAADSGEKPEFTADKGGAYVFSVEEIQRGAAAYGGGYEHDPNAAPSETILSTQSQTVYFASALKCQLGVSPDTAELQLYVYNASVVPTTTNEHGVVSPTLQNIKTPKARIAAESAAVRAAVTDLSGETATTVVGDISDVINDLIEKFNLHREQFPVHDEDDTDNVIADDFLNPKTTDSQKKTLGELRKKLDQHMRNDDPTATTPGTGSASPVYHETASGRVDWENGLLNVSASDQNTVLISVADTWRSFAGHLLSDVHDNADTFNTPDALPLLLNLHRLFLAQLAAQAPTTPPNEHPGKAILVNAAGFTEL